jgi:hypothetical protein
MYRYLVDERAASAYLTRISQNGNVELHDVAARIVADTYRDPSHGPLTPFGRVRNPRMGTA